MILVDANVLIDVIVTPSTWEAWSLNELISANDRDALAINHIIYAELAPSFPHKIALDTFLHDLSIQILPVTDDVAYAAATAHRGYRKSGGQRTATLPDFFIGAHASVQNYTLLTRDPKRIRTYFPDVKLITPE